MSASILYTMLYVLAAIGLRVAERRATVWFSVAVLGISPWVHVLMLVLWRYRVPYWDPILLLYGARGAAELLPPGRRFSPAG